MRTLRHSAPALTAALLAALAFDSASARIASAQSANAQSAHAPPARGDLLDRAVSQWAKVRTVRASFEQTIENPLTGTDLHASGEYQQQRPAKLSVKFNDPATDRIVADGKYVWLYLPSTTPGQVIRTTAQAAGTGTVDLTAQFLTSPRTRYVVSPAPALSVNGRPTHGYVLVPRATHGAPFQKAVVQIDDADASVREFVVTENSGIQRTVRLTSFRTNVPVDASAFTFTPPAGVRVVAR